MKDVVKVLAPLFALACVVGCGRADVGSLNSGNNNNPNDGGGVRTDSGPILFDGSGPFDSGPITPGDAGPNPRDTGPNPRDTGPNPRDTGPNPRDTGPNPRDTGPNPADAGPNPECRRARDCFEQFGPPPPCMDGPSRWQCTRAGTCEVECIQPNGCMSDCDCAEELSCAPNGTCQPLNRRNQCCVFGCPPGDTCVNPNGSTVMCPPGPGDAGVPGDGGPTPDAGPQPDAGPTPDAGPPPQTPVGAMCTQQGPQCAPGFCIDEQSGFPDGYCSEQCTNAGGMNSCPGDAICANFGQGQRLCLDGCVNNNECRTDYACVQLGQLPGRVCYPAPPGSMNPNGAPVGSACMATNDCGAGQECLQFQGWPGGYCTVTQCDPQNRPCPGGSACYNFPSLFALCLADCPNGGAQSTCRQDYYCFGPSGQPGGCLPN